MDTNPQLASFLAMQDTPSQGHGGSQGDPQCTFTLGDVKRLIDLSMLAQDSEIRRLADKVAELEEDAVEFRRKLGMYAMLECGQVPQVDDLTRIGCQVWFTPNLTAEQRRIKSVWSLRLAIDIKHHRVTEEINVRLFPLKEFWAMAKKPKHRTDAVTQLCEMLIAKGQRDTTWAGFVQSFTRNGGRPYCKEQLAVLMYHDEDRSPTATQAKMHLMIGGQVLGFGSMRPSAGGEASSLWYCDWRPCSQSRNNTRQRTTSHPYA